MQILKGSDQRHPDFNEYVYSKGTIYEHHDIDKVDRFRKACNATMKSNDYSNVTAEWVEVRKKAVDTILNRYPPHFAIGTRWQYLTEREEEKIRWSTEGLTVLSEDLTQFGYFRVDMGHRILEWAEFDFNNWSLDSKAELALQLAKFEVLINNATDEK